MRPQSGTSALQAPPRALMNCVSLELSQGGWVGCCAVPCPDGWVGLCGMARVKARVGGVGWHPVTLSPPEGQRNATQAGRLLASLDGLYYE
jgi:hypothetical protein